MDHFQVSLSLFLEGSLSMKIFAMVISSTFSMNEN